MPRPQHLVVSASDWLGRKDSNLRSPDPETCTGSSDRFPFCYQILCRNSTIRRATGLNSRTLSGSSKNAKTRAAGAGKTDMRERALSAGRRWPKTPALCTTAASGLFDVSSVQSMATRLPSILAWQEPPLSVSTSAALQVGSRGSKIGSAGASVGDPRSRRGRGRLHRSDTLWHRLSGPRTGARRRGPP